MGLLARLDAKLDRSAGPSACWPFTGALSRGQHRETSYGSIKEGPQKGKVWRVNRLVLLLEEIPLEECWSEGELLRWLHLADRFRADWEAAHSCDRSTCGNPAHLQWESHRMNVQEQGRRVRERRRGEEASA